MAQPIQIHGDSTFVLPPATVVFLFEVLETHRGFNKREIDPHYSLLIGQLEAQEAKKAQEQAAADAKAVEAAAESVVKNGQHENRLAKVT